MHGKLMGVALGLVVSACSTGNALSLRTSADDGQGPMTANCRNVSQSAQANHDPWAFYHTTWGSAWVEGATEGFYEGIEEAGVFKFQAGEDGQVVTNTPIGLRPYCLSINASYARTLAAVERTLPLLNAPVDEARPEYGYFTTERVLRRHKGAEASEISAARPAWRESYELRVLNHTEDWTVVRVTRAVQISRQEGTYNPAASSGHNEVWILNQVKDAVLSEPEPVGE